MPPFNRGRLGLAPWVIALVSLAPVSSAWAQAEAPATTQASGEAQPAAVAQPAAAALQPAATGLQSAETGAALDYASQAALKVDEYFAKIVMALQSVSREGPAGFDTQLPQIAGPAGKPLPVVYTERLTDRLVNHPRDAAFLTRDDVAAALRGRQVQVRDGQLFFTVANPGGASVIGVAIPASELVAGLPDAATPGGILLFDLGGHPVALKGDLTADQLGVFERFLPQKPPSLIVTETPYSVASSTRADLLVVTRMLGGGIAPEAPLPDALFIAPTLIKKAGADPQADLMSKAAIALPLGVGLLGGFLIFLFRRRRERPQFERLRDSKEVPDLPGVDYLDALTEAHAETSRTGRGSGPFGLAIEGEDAVATSFEPGTGFEEGVGEVRVLKGPTDAHADAQAVARPNQPADALADQPTFALTDQPEDIQADEPAGESADEPLDNSADEPADEPADELADGPAEVDQMLADLIESTAQDIADSPPSAAGTPEESEQERLEQEQPGQDPQEGAEMRGRAARLKERLAERFDFFKTSARSSEPAEPVAPPPVSGLAPSRRDVIHIGRSGASDETPDLRRKQKTVNPGDVLISKGEAQGLVEKETDKLMARMQGLMRDLEIRTAEALAVHRETFRELLEQFESLQENRDHDLASMHDLKNQLANEVTAATLKLKQAESKATDGMLRLKEQMDNLTRKLEGWACDAKISEERLTGALETIRDGWENQMEAHAELRKEVMRLTESMQDLGRKQEASSDRESAERRAAIDQLAFEIKTVQLSTENDFSLMASRVDELKTGLGTLAQRLDRTEGHQAQAIEGVYRKIEAGEGLEALRHRFGLELEGLKGQLYQEMEEAMTTAARGRMAYQEQIDSLKEENGRLSQRQHQIVQLMANLHSALGKSDARAAEEVERLKAQNAELQQMMLSMMRSGPRPPAQPGQSPPQGAQGQPQRRPAPPADQRPMHQSPQPGQPGGPPQPAAPPPGSGQAPHAPAAAGHAQPPGPAADPNAGSPAPGAQLPEIQTRPAAQPAESRHRQHAEEVAHEPKPIDLWGRLLGRERQPTDEQTSQRKRRSK